MTLPRQDFAEAIRVLYDAFNRQDVPRCVAFFDPRVEWHSAENFLYADRSPYIGIDAVRHLIFDRLRDDWDEFKLDAGEILGSGDVVIASGRFAGKFKANGASVDAQFVQVFQFQNGKIVKAQVYTDTAQFKETVSRAAA